MGVEPGPGVSAVVGVVGVTVSGYGYFDEAAPCGET